MEVSEMITEQMINELEQALIEEIRSTLSLWRIEKQEQKEAKKESTTTGP